MPSPSLVRILVTNPDEALKARSDSTEVGGTVYSPNEMTDTDISHSQKSVVTEITGMR